MDEPQPDEADSTSVQTAEHALAVRGLGLALTARSLRALLEPATRAESEVVVDLSQLSIEVPASAVAAVIAAVAPDLGVELGENSATVRLAGAPAIRCLAPAAGVRVRLKSDRLTIGEPSDD
jgi:hypothetical protein